MIVPQTEVIVTKDGAELGRFVVTPGEYVIGREGDIPVEADLVSRRHALLTVNYDNWLIEDLGSTNGTLLNGERVSGATRVWPSQKIQLGTAVIELHRMQTQPADGQSLSPQAASVRRYLPPEFLRGSKYAIERPIAQGGMGAILAAQEAGLRRPVAMKVMLDSAGESDLLRFIEEAQITGQLQHPNIVPVYELGVDEHDQVFYTMKLVEGITLKKSPRTAPRRHPSHGGKIFPQRAAHHFSESLRRSRVCAREARHPPRPETREPHARQLRRSARHGLGSRESDRQSRIART